MDSVNRRLTLPTPRALDVLLSPSARLVLLGWNPDCLSGGFYDRSDTWINDVRESTVVPSLNRRN